MATDIDIWLAERDTPEAVGLDLNGLWHGEAAGFRLLRLKLGQESKPKFLSAGQAAGGEVTSVETPPVRGFIELSSEGADLPALAELYRTLAGFFTREASLVIQPAGYDEPSIIDTYPSDIGSIFEGSTDSEGAFLAEGVDESIRIDFWHHPRPRRGGVNLATAVSLANGLGGVNLLEVTNPGDVESEGRLQLAVPGDEHVVWALAGVKEGTLEFPSYDLTGVEPVFVARQMLHRQVLEPTDPAAFAGTYRVIAVYTGAEDVFHFQMLSGTAVNGPQGRSGPEVEHDWTGVSSFQRVPLDLGEVSIDPHDPRVVIEIHGSSEAGTDVGSWGEVYLIPSDTTLLELAVPGFLSGTYGLVKYDASTLTLEGDPETTDDGAVILEAGQSASIPGVFGDSNRYAIGLHICEARCKVRNKDRTKEKEGEIQVFVNGEVTASITRNIASRRGEAVTTFGEDDRRFVTFEVTDTADEYRETVEFTEAGGPGKRIHLERLRHSYVPWVTGGRAMVVDQGITESFVADDTGARISSLHRTATFFLGAGLHTIATLFGVQSPNRYDGVDRRGTLPVIAEVAAEGTVDVTPRTLHP